MEEIGANRDKILKLIADVGEAGGGERANYQKFINELAEALGLEKPHYSRDDTAQNNYVFERKIAFTHDDGSTTPGYIDCYKRDCFILEAKQSPKRKRELDRQEPHVRQSDMFGKAKARELKVTALDKIMRSAKSQAEDYARALPEDHEYPPFILVVDVGHVIEIFSDFKRQGRRYTQFPDAQTYRITLADLAKPEVQERLRAIWQNPSSLDPNIESARVTKDVADRLAIVAKVLEKNHDAKDVAEFLMRCLFTMFAEDAKLLPDKAFENLLLELKDTPKNFVPAVESLWNTMNGGGYAPYLNETLRRFNGGLFAHAHALPLERDQITELHIAATRKWQDVEPAIFGTLLERALDERERSKLGAHYTPRSYVERLVEPTIMEPLWQDWQEAQNVAHLLDEQHEPAKALAVIKAFHRKLCTTRVLDPACGTGNFLYVSFELMKKLEGLVLREITDRGGAPDTYADFQNDVPESIKGRQLTQGGGFFSVGPHQFYGLELNKRAVPIAELVLWIGFLKWQIRTTGLENIKDPVLDNYGTIKEQDAILAYDAREVVKDARGIPLSRWNGVTKKLHPITGEEVPDPSATVEIYKYTNPRRAVWPEAEFIVGNPPFIGGKDMRQELGDGYAENCWNVRPKIPGGADFVMHFWDEAAERLLRKGTVNEPNPLRRFGFITTNSITQTFSRRVIETHMRGKAPLSLIFAVPDHPWLKASDKAAVRIAMTVAVKGDVQGFLREVSEESGLNTDNPEIKFTEIKGKILPNLTVGADIGSAVELLSNRDISCAGVKLHGPGFIVTPQQAVGLGLGRAPGLDKHILLYRNGRDLAQRPRAVMVIDLFGLTIAEVQRRFPAVFQHVLENVKPERDHNRDKEINANWWLFGRTRTEFRDFVAALPRYIATVETSKHRFFQFLDASIRPDNMLVNIGIQNAAALAVLSSRYHVCWAITSGGWLGIGNDPRYTKTRTFDPFPFPDLSNNTALQDRLRELGERLDAFRKERLAAHDFLTMTGLYNALERYRELNADIGEALSESERAVHEAGLISVLAEIHDDIDRATLSAYRWADLIPALVGKPGGTVPSDHKAEIQLEAEEELLRRLVALNHERAEEEKRGVIRWLRPEYQIPKFGKKLPAAKTEELDLEIFEEVGKPKWPATDRDQIKAVSSLLANSSGLSSADDVARAFDGRNTAARKQRVALILETMVATGTVMADKDKFFIVK